MTIDNFWDLIRKSRRGATQDCYRIAENLTGRLEKLEPEEIISFQEHLWDRVSESYRRDLWAIFTLVSGFAFGDAFEDFRCWLIAQGREFFEEVMQDPQRLERRLKREEMDGEPLLYAAPQAYENRTGEDMPEELDFNLPTELQGERTTEEDLKNLYPRLFKKFS